MTKKTRLECAGEGADHFQHYSKKIPSVELNPFLDNFKLVTTWIFSAHENKKIAFESRAQFPEKKNYLVNQAKTPKPTYSAQAPAN